MSRIDVETANNARCSQTNDAPIVAGGSFASRLPAVHPFAVVGVFVRNENGFTAFD